MKFIDEIKQRAKSNIKTICLPEASDIRTIEAASIALKEEYAKIILVGEEEKIKKMAEENGFDISKATIINPKTSSRKEEYANKLFELRQAKGMTKEEADKLVEDEVYFGMMMVKMNEADGLVSGAIHSTSDTLRPALQILKTAPRNKTCISFFCYVCTRL